MAFTEMNYPSSGGGYTLDLEGALSVSLSRTGSTSVTIDLSKDYILFGAQCDNDAVTRQAAVLISGGVVTNIPNAGTIGNMYVTPNINQQTGVLTLTHNSAATNYGRYVLLKLN